MHSLCAQFKFEIMNKIIKDNERIEVAEYLTKLPDKKLLEQKLQEAIILAKNQLKK